ncbi:MAG: mechanosensitive ion channel family protein [Oscillospiraceae bacterium]|nr:mechanosensitive ion channel family protein [Oscillospiraceae bacterium]
MLIIICAVFFIMQYAWNAPIATQESLTQHRMLIYDIAQEMERQAAQQAAVEKDINDNRINTVELFGKAMKTLAGKTGLDSMKSYLAGQNMAVLRFRNGAIQPSENMPAGLRIEPESISEEKGMFLGAADDQKSYIIYYYKMSGDSCLLMWEELKDNLIYNTILTERTKTIRAYESAMEINVLQFPLLDGQDMTSAEPIYAAEAFSDYHSARDFGITQEMLDSATEIERDRFVSFRSGASGTLTGARSLTVEGVPYECYFRKTDKGTTVTVFMIPSDQPTVRAAERTALLLALFAIMGISFLAWALSVYVLVIRHKLNDEQKKIFFPRMVYKRAAVYILSGILPVAGVALFLQCLFASYFVSATAEETLRALGARLESNTAMAEAVQSAKMKAYETSAETISLLTFSEGEQVNPTALDSACAAIGADYIIIYDETGTQVVSNAAYRGLTLEDGGEDMQEFSRLLKGASPISKALVTDAQTSMKHAVFGVSLPRSADNGRDISYWAMLLFVDPHRITDQSALSGDEIMQSINTSYTMCFGVDLETGRIVSSSRRSLIGKDAFSLGLPEEALTDHYRGFFWVDDNRVYGTSAEMDGTLYYYIFQQQQMYQHISQNTFRAVLTYLVLMTALALYLFFGYKKTFDSYSDQGKELQNAENRVMTSSGKIRASLDPSLRWKWTEVAFGQYTPVQNAIWVGEAFYMLAVIATVVYIILGFDSTDFSNLAYILGSKWSKGFNLFAITNIVFLFIGISAVTILCRFIIGIVTRYLDTKGETIGRLLLDFIRYLSIIVFAYFSLSFIGVNTAALVASIGIFTFALSLGAQELIRDIIAGLSIVMDGEYQVGDIVEIGGFRGEVLSVGVRTTKIEGRGGNILIMGNRDVKNVINKTRKNSWYALDINISENEDLGKVETMLKENLPQIGKSIPEIISGPVYKGVVNLGKGTLSLSVIAECTEADYHEVQRKLNGAMAVLFEKHGISIK